MYRKKKTATIDGKEYTWRTWYRYKVDANAEATRLRKNHKSVRIIPTNRPHEYHGYDIFSRG